MVSYTYFSQSIRVGRWQSVSTDPVTETLIRFWLLKCLYGTLVIGSRSLFIPIPIRQKSPSSVRQHVKLHALSSKPFLYNINLSHGGLGLSEKDHAGFLFYLWLKPRTIIGRKGVQFLGKYAGLLLVSDIFGKGISVWAVQPFYKPEGLYASSLFRAGLFELV